MNTPRISLLVTAIAAVGIVGVLALRSPSPDPVIGAAISQAHRQLAESIRVREEALTDATEIQRISAVADELLASEQSASEKSASEKSASEKSASEKSASEKPASEKPASEKPASEKPDAALQQAALQRATEKLISERDALLLRGSADAFGAEAAVQWDLENLRELALRSGIPGYPPDNEFELLDRPTLDKLKSRWEARHDQTRLRQAVPPPSVAAAEAMRMAESRLAAIKAALGVPQVKPPTRHRPREGLADWAEARQRARASEVAMREQDALRVRLAAVPDDIAAQVRAAELEGRMGKTPASTTTLASIVNGARRLIARAMFFALGPRAQTAGEPPPADVGSFLRDILIDPVGAAQNEAALRMQWEDLRSITDADARSRVLPADLATSFEDWTVAHLGDSDLPVCVRLLADVNDRVRRQRAKSGANALEGFPEARLQKFAAALDREVTFRVTQKRSRALDALPEMELLRRHAQGRPGSVPATSTAMRIEADVLREYGAQAGWHPELQRRQLALVLDEAERQIVILEERAETLHEARLKVSAEDATFEPEVGEALGEAGGLVRAQLDRLWEVLDAPALVAESGRAAGMKGRLMAVARLSSPAPWRPRGNAPATPPAQVFETATFDHGNKQLQNLIQRLQSPRPVEQHPEKTAYVAMRSNSALEVMAIERARPEAEAWNRDGKAVAYADIDSLRSIGALPGGVAFGRVAKAVDDWRAYALVYDGVSREVRLVSPTDAWSLGRIPPDELKACLRFARAQADSVAVSIGYTSDASSSGGTPFREAQRVRVHPSLRDTKVGRDLIEADRLPWSLKEERLPNGQPNPVAERMGGLLKRLDARSGGALPTQDLLRHMAALDLSVEGRTSEDLLKAAARGDPSTALDLMFIAVAEAQTSRRARLAKFHELADRYDVGDKPDLIKAVEALLSSLPPERGRALLALCYIGFDNEKVVPWRTVERMFLVLGAVEHEQEPSPASRQPITDMAAATRILAMMQARRLSLLTDLDTRLEKGADRRIEIESALRVRYVQGEVQARSDGLRLTDGATMDEKASVAATESLPTLEKAYPFIAEAKKYAAWIAILRWASTSNVAWVDMADLATTKSHTPQWRTPDYFCEGNVQTCIAEVSRH